MDNFQLLKWLTGYVDGRLPPGQAADVERMMVERPAVRELADRLRAAGREVGTALLRARPKPSTAVRGADCIDDDGLVRLCDGLLSPLQRKAIEDHLLTCDYCVAQVVSEMRSHVSLERDNWPGLPPEVAGKAAVQSLVHVEKPKDHDEDHSALIITTDARAPIRHRVRGGTLEVELLFSPLDGGEAFGLSLQMKDSAGKVAGRQVTVQDDEAGRKLVSSPADKEGAFKVRRLPRGRYTIHFLGSICKVGIEIADPEE